MLCIYFHCAHILLSSFRMQELSYREFESACDQSKRCEQLGGISRERCVRECISPSCYKEIYEFDAVNITISLMLILI